MTDVLDRLRADNPVNDGSPPSFEEVWGRLEREAGTTGSSRRRRRTRTAALGAAALIPVAAVVVIALGTLGSRGAAPVGGGAAGPGVLVHYSARSIYRPAHSSGASFAYEVTDSQVWISGASRHRIDTSFFFSRRGRQQGAPLRLELATNGRRLETFQAGSLAPRGLLSLNAPAPPLRTCPMIVGCGAEVSVDPLAEARQLYRSGYLRLTATDMRLDGREVDELRGSHRNVVVMFVDARSFLPVKIIVQYGTRPWPASPVATTTISDYQRTPLTASERPLLAMRPHPGAPATCGVVKSNGRGGNVLSLLHRLNRNCKALVTGR